MPTLTPLIMRRIIAVGTMMLMAACGDSSTGITAASVAGTYNLSTVNGGGLPAVVATNPKLEVLGDVLVLSAAGSFTDKTIYRITQGTSVTTDSSSDAGAFVVSGTSVALHFSSDGTTSTGTISGTSLLVTQGGFSNVYVKQ